jgi:hypothetical protein
MRLAFLERNARATIALSVAIGALALGCSSSPPAANSFTEVYTKVLQPTCTNDFCHYPNVGIRYGALDLSTQVAAYWSLVDQLCAGAACSGMGNRRVIPGDPASSILYEKISESQPPCGAQMPADMDALTQTGTIVFSGTALSAAQQRLIYDWIYVGAPNN